ncbi:DNA helicase [Tanacetum coccineum]
MQTVVNNPTKKKTTLTEWLEYNKHYTDGRHLTYLNFPSEYTWNPTDKYWQRRHNLNKPSIGRLTYVHPSLGELFYERILLCHQKGCKNFNDIRTVNDTMYPTNRAACEALGLLNNDQEWVCALEEAAEHTLENAHYSKNRKNEAEMQGSVLLDIEALLNSTSRSLKDFGLPMPPKRFLNTLRNKFVMEKKNYNRLLLLKQKDLLIPKLNKDQRVIFDLILNAVKTKVQELVFVYGYVTLESGKPSIGKQITCALRSYAKNCFGCCIFRHCGFTTTSWKNSHSRFKIPLNLKDESICNIKKNSHLADLLGETDLIIRDEAPMNDSLCFEALDRSLRDILDNPHTSFGSKSMILKVSLFGKRCC